MGGEYKMHFNMSSPHQLHCVVLDNYPMCIKFSRHTVCIDGNGQYECASNG